MAVTHCTERVRGERQVTLFEGKIQHSVFGNILRIENRVLHVRVIDHSLLTEKVNLLHRVATLPEKMAQIAIRADLFADGFPQPQERARIVNNKVWMHFKSEAMDTVIAREFRRFLPVRNDLLLPLPLQHLVVLFWPTVSHPVGLRVCRRPSRATGESLDYLHINQLG